MKKTYQKDITLFVSILSLLLIVSLIIALLYTLDWITPGFFLFVSEGLGFIFYMITA